MKRTAVLNVVGLTQRHIGPNTPTIANFLSLGQAATIEPAFPAVTCTAQSNYLTGKRPSDHGIVGNGWYNHELAEVTFWKQPNQTVQAPKLWHDLRLVNGDFTCAAMFLVVQHVRRHRMVGDAPSDLSGRWQQAF